MFTVFSYILECYTILTERLLIYEGQNLIQELNFKVGLSPSEKYDFIYFNESLLKPMKNPFYFMLKTLTILEICTLLF